MRKSFPTYLIALSGDDYEVLEELILYKYKKFIDLYYLLQDFSDYITTLKYKTTKKDVLKITVTMNKLKTEKVLNTISSKISNCAGNVLLWNEGKTIHIEITKDE